MKPSHEQVRLAADAIEAEMRLAGLWSHTRPPDAAFSFTRAFGADTMAFEQWLQFVFLPRVRDLLRTHGEFPPHSDVGAYAVREFDGRDELSALVSQLCAFDALFNNSLPPSDPRATLGWKDWLAVAVLGAGLLWIVIDTLL